MRNNGPYAHPFEKMGEAMTTPPSPSRSFTCPVCGQSRPAREAVDGNAVRPAVSDLVRKRRPDWQPGEGICLACLNEFRAAYVEDVLEEDKGELSALEKDVVDSFKELDLVASNLNTEFDRQLTFGERLADKIADFGGSWRFISIFVAVLLGWIAINSVALLQKPFDPYPYILLNLVLSCLAAIQAPVIMMSQNRQEAKDRLRAEHDYRVNLKAELEIRHLNEKLDMLLTRHWERLVKIQEGQVELLQELGRARHGGGRP